MTEDNLQHFLAGTTTSRRTTVRDKGREQFAAVHESDREEIKRSELGRGIIVGGQLHESHKNIAYRMLTDGDDSAPAPSRVHNRFFGPLPRTPTIIVDESGRMHSMVGGDTEIIDEAPLRTDEPIEPTLDG